MLDEQVLDTYADPEDHRVELTGYCYRMLGSAFDAEDAAQETLLRAWLHADRYDARRARMRTWLYAIATGVCLDMLRSARRRALATDLTSTAPELGTPLPERAFVLPAPDDGVLPQGGDPAELAAARETVRLAFVAALQLLPPRQRAVLVLRDVLRFSTAEVAELVGTTPAATAGALARARATIAAARPVATEPLRPADPVQRKLLERYCAAFERHDVEGLLALMHEDVTVAMPPFSWWLRGRAAVRELLTAAPDACAGARLVPTAANGAPAFWQTRPTGPGGTHEPFALVVLDVADGLITGATTFLDGPRLATLFAYS